MVSDGGNVIATRAGRESFGAETVVLVAHSAPAATSVMTAATVHGSHERRPGAAAGRCEPEDGAATMSSSTTAASPMSRSRFGSFRRHRLSRSTIG